MRTVLSKQEAEDLREPFRAALGDMGDYTDQGLRKWRGDPLYPDVWGDLTDTELDVLTRLSLRRGQRDPKAAEFVRNVVEYSDWVSAGIIVVPRSIKTIQAMVTPRRPRLPKGAQKR